MIRKISKTIFSIGAVATLSLAISGGVERCFAQADSPFLGQLAYVAFNFAPQGWAKCDGGQLAISQNQALYALLGVTYGGNGQTTFALPDMRGRVPVHQGQGTGLPNYSMGQNGGTANVSLIVSNLPAHTHTATAVSTSTSSVGTATTATSTLRAFNGSGVAKAAGGNSLAALVGASAAVNIYGTATPNVDMMANSVTTTIDNIAVNTNTTTSVTVGSTGLGQPFSIMPPYLTVNCIIATEGIFPSRPD